MLSLIILAIIMCHSINHQVECQEAGVDTCLNNDCNDVILSSTGFLYGKNYSLDNASSIEDHICSTCESTKPCGNGVSNQICPCSRSNPGKCAIPTTAMCTSASSSPKQAVCVGKNKLIKDVDICQHWAKGGYDIRSVVQPPISSTHSAFDQCGDDFDVQMMIPRRKDSQEAKIPLRYGYTIPASSFLRIKYRDVNNRVKRQSAINGGTCDLVIIEGSCFECTCKGMKCNQLQVETDGPAGFIVVGITSPNTHVLYWLHHNSDDQSDALHSLVHYMRNPPTRQNDTTDNDSPCMHNYHSTKLLDPENRTRVKPMEFIERLAILLIIPDVVGIILLILYCHPPNWELFGTEPPPREVKSVVVGALSNEEDVAVKSKSRTVTGKQKTEPAISKDSPESNPIKVDKTPSSTPKSTNILIDDDTYVAINHDQNPSTPLTQAKSEEKDQNLTCQTSNKLICSFDLIDPTVKDQQSINEVSLMKQESQQNSTVQVQRSTPHLEPQKVQQQPNQFVKVQVGRLGSKPAKAVPLKRLGSSPRRIPEPQPNQPREHPTVGLDTRPTPGMTETPPQKAEMVRVFTIPIAKEGNDQSASTNVNPGVQHIKLA